MLLIRNHWTDLLVGRIVFSSIERNWTHINIYFFVPELEKGREEMDLKILDSLQFHKENSSVRTQAIVNATKSFELLYSAIANKLMTSNVNDSQAIVRKLWIIIRDRTCWNSSNLSLSWNDFFFSFFEIVNYCQKWIIIILKSAVKKCVIII